MGLQNKTWLSKEYREIKRDLWQKAICKEKGLITMRPFLQSYVKFLSEL